MAQQGIVALIIFTSLLSINLGLINLFPVPMLDGGHLVFYGFEAALGKPIPDHVQEYAFRFGLVFLVFIMVFANINDIVQLVL
jgi:regulator of sigma E protease